MVVPDFLRPLEVAGGSFTVLMIRSVNMCSVYCSARPFRYKLWRRFPRGGKALMENNIRTPRKAAGKTQDELAKAVGVSYAPRVGGSGVMANRPAREFSWGQFDDPFVDELARWIGGRRVLEVFAGNGLLASKLASRGIDIISTSLFRGHDAHEEGMFHPVIEMEASVAVLRHGEGRDVLLMAWPVSDETAARATALWGDAKPVIFIGEVTDLEKGHLGGCASDAFFEFTVETEAFGSYRPRNMLERAAVRMLDPVALTAHLRVREEEIRTMFPR
jgi:transcriptional regulator with XRE-family HTH domain